MTSFVPSLASLKLCAATSVLLLQILPASAAVANGNFLSDLSGWTSVGDVSVQSAGPAITGNGSAYALLTTASLTFQDDFPSAAGKFNYSKSASAVDVSVLESSIGVASGALDPDVANFAYAYEGSGLAKTVTVAAGDTLSFRWNFLSNETSPTFADYAFLNLNGSIIRLADTSSTLASSSAFALETGYKTYSHTFTQGATFKLAFGLVDVGDYDTTSALAISNVQIAASVPEPIEAMMLTLGLGVIGLVVRRRRQSA